MKKNVIALMVCLLSFILFACNKEANADKIELPSGELWVVNSSSIDPGKKEIKNIIFKEDDIKSFHQGRGEIVFNNLTVEEIGKRIKSKDASLDYCIGEKLLFNSAFISMSSSVVHDDLSLIIMGAKCYLLNGYPSLDVIGYNKDEHKKIREANALKNQEAWNVFIKYLEEKGKLR